NDLTNDADRFVLGVTKILALDRNGLAVILVGPSGVIAIASYGQRNIGGARDMIRLAVVEGLELRELCRVFLNQVGELVHQVAALRSRQLLAPRAVVESGARGGYGLVDIGGIRFGNLRDGFSGGRIDGRKGLAGGGVGPFVVDEQFGGTDFNGWFNGSGSSRHADSSQRRGKAPDGNKPTTKEFAFARSRQDGATPFGRRFVQRTCKPCSPRRANDKSVLRRKGRSKVSEDGVRAVRAVLEPSFTSGRTSRKARLMLKARSAPWSCPPG